MKKYIIFAVALTISCGLLSGCSGESSQTAEQQVSYDTEYENQWEDAVEMELTGRCVKGTDGMLLFAGEGENQEVYILVGDTSENNLLNSINDGDDISINGKVLLKFFPCNVRISDGTVTHSDEKMTLRKSLADSLVSLYMLDKSIYEDSRFEISE